MKPETRNTKHRYSLSAIRYSLSARSRSEQGFTLIEVTIVGFIILLLSLGLVLILDPFELIDRSRDDVRAREIGTLVDIMEITRNEKGGSFDPDGPEANSCVGESAQKVFVSVPNSETPPDDLPTGWTYAQVGEANLRNADGTGWLPVNMRGQSISLVQRATGSTSSDGGNVNVSANYPSTPQANNLLVALHVSDDANPPSALPTGWVAAVEQQFNSGSSHAGIYYKVAGASEPLVMTFTIGAASHQTLSILEYSGLATTNVLDQVQSNSCGNQSTCSTGTTAATTQANELVIAGFGLGDGESFLDTWTNGFARLSIAQSSGDGRIDRVTQSTAHFIASGTGTFETTETTGGTVRWGGVIATFKGLGASGSASSAFLTHLPVDPTNTFASGHYYSYVCKRGGSNFEFTSRMQSKKYRTGGAEDIQSSGGVVPDVLVVSVAVPSSYDTSVFVVSLCTHAA